MPQTALQICRTELEKLYQEKLGQSFSSSIRDAQSKPVWRFVSAQDLITPVAEEKSNAAGLLLDPEIGIVFYLLPFGSKTAAADIRKQILHALSIRSQLSTERNYTGKLTNKVDPNGAWRVVLHWLVLGEKMRQSWIDQIMKVRRETAFSEEVCFDAIFVNDSNVIAQVKRHGFSRLLLTTRQVFRKAHFEQVNRWMSADDLVAKAIEDFGSSFHDTAQRSLAESLRAAAKNYKTESRREARAFAPPDSPRDLKKIHVLNFRNIRDATFDFGRNAVGARVVHGPNGTGKSSLCEALSLALFGSSLRYKAFSDRALEVDCLSVKPFALSSGLSDSD